MGLHLVEKMVYQSDWKMVTWRAKSMADHLESGLVPKKDCLLAKDYCLV